MTDQTHVVGEVRPVPLFDKIIRTVNSSAEIQSLLYDLGLLPEQTMDDPLQWARTGSIALELAERDEQIRALRIQVGQADERGDEAMRRAHGAERELEQLRGENAVLAGILSDCDNVLATIIADDLDEAEKIGDLRRAIAYALDPYKREGTLL